MKKNNNPGCGAAFLGTLVALLATGAYIALSLLCNRLFLGRALNGEPACAFSTFFTTGIGIVFFLFELVFVIWLIKRARAATDNSDGGVMKTVLRIAAAGAAALSILLAVISANIYTKCSDTSITTVTVFSEREYEWDDVSRFIFSCDDSGALKYTVRMKDGESIEIFNNVNTCSDEFTERFGSLLSYASYLTEQFRASEFIIEEKISGVENMEKRFKESDPVAWETIESIISPLSDTE